MTKITEANYEYLNIDVKNREKFKQILSTRKDYTNHIILSVAMDSASSIKENYTKYNNMCKQGARIIRKILFTKYLEQQLDINMFDIGGMSEIELDNYISDGYDIFRKYIACFKNKLTKELITKRDVLALLIMCYKNIFDKKIFLTNKVHKKLTMVLHETYPKCVIINNKSYSIDKKRFKLHLDLYQLRNLDCRYIDNIYFKLFFSIRKKYVRKKNIEPTTADDLLAYVHIFQKKIRKKKEKNIVLIGDTRRYPCMYLVTSKSMNVVKAGIWTGSQKNLYNRYRTTCGKTLRIFNVKLMGNLRQYERNFAKKFKKYNFDSELYIQEYYDEYEEYLISLRENEKKTDAYNESDNDSELDNEQDESDNE